MKITDGNIPGYKTMKVNIKKLSDKAVIPAKSHPEDAGFDLTATSRKTDPRGFTEYGTSLAFAIPENHVGLLFPRSSISNKNMTLTNSVGVLDSSFRGEVRFRFKPSTTGRELYEVGDRVGQLIILPYPQIEFNEVSELDETERNEGGFGSTDQPKVQINENGMVITDE